MDKLKDFISLLSGSFDNSEQYRQMQARGRADFPFAEHLNTVCNDCISGLPENFEGIFLVEESYYTVAGKTHASPHLFLFTREEDGILLTSYETPEGYDRNSFTAGQLRNVPYNILRRSEKFTPALYRLCGGVWEGGSTSQFSPALTFKLFERFSTDVLEVSEEMFVNGRRTFGYDEPILYRRK